VQHLASVAEELAEQEESYRHSPEGQRARANLLLQARALDSENVSMQQSPEQLLFGQGRAGQTPVGRNLLQGLQQVQQRSQSEEASSSRQSTRLAKVKAMKRQD